MNITDEPCTNNTTLSLNTCDGEIYNGTTYLKTRSKTRPSSILIEPLVNMTMY